MPRNAVRGGAQSVAVVGYARSRRRRAEKWTRPSHLPQPGRGMMHGHMARARNPQARAGGCKWPYRSLRQFAQRHKTQNSARMCRRQALRLRTCDGRTQSPPTNRARFAKRGRVRAPGGAECSFAGAPTTHLVSVPVLPWEGRSPELIFCHVQRIFECQVS